MVTPLFSPAQATRLKVIRDRGAGTVRLFHDDSYAVWIRVRPDGAGASWDDGTTGERWEQNGAGTGKLYENGAGGPTTGEDVIYVESPYRFRTLTSAAFDTTMHLVINGQRLFRVDAFKVEDIDDRLANAYLSELLDHPLPVPTP